MISRTNCGLKLCATMTKLVIFAFIILLGCTCAFAPIPEAAFTRTSVRVQDKPFAAVVQAEIAPDRLNEFLELIETNAVETRKEPGCLRFDVLQSQEAENKFFFYELYKSASDVDYHKTQPHYNRWADFKASGGVINSVTYKTDGVYIT